MLTGMPHEGRAVSYLRQVAMSSDETAYRAVELLARDLGQAGLAQLRQLHDAGAVTEPFALETLQGIAEYHGWR